MSIRIKISYTDEREAELVLFHLKPIIPAFKVKKSASKPPYKHIYFTPKKAEKD